MSLRILFATLLLAGLGRPVAAQAPLTLAEALARAERGAFANRLAAGRLEAQRGAALAPYGGILPTLRIEGSAMRTTAPLTAFGFTLRQRAVTASAFAPARLNDPDATSNLSTGLLLEQPLFNADAWLGRQAASEAAHAARAEAEWTRTQTGVDVVRAYWGAVLARQQVRTLRAALDAASAHERQAESLARQGMVTRADLLLAGVRVGAIQTALLEAGHLASHSHLQLAILLGDPGDTTFVLPEALPSSARLRPTLEAGLITEGGDRADLEAAVAARAAAEADRRRATSLYLPRLNGFGRLDWNSADAPFGGQSAWTLGVMVTWTPFAGGSAIAQQREARGREAVARAMVETAQARAHLETQQARDAVRIALIRLEITGRGVVQATEAHRLVSRKYAGGLATISELLEASAQETAATMADLSAAYTAIVALAEVRKANGLDLSPLQTLDHEGER